MAGVQIYARGAACSRVLAGECGRIQHPTPYDFFGVPAQVGQPKPTVADHGCGSTTRRSEVVQLPWKATMPYMLVAWPGSLMPARWPTAMVHPEQPTDRRITRGVADSLRRALSQQINGFHVF